MELGVIEMAVMTLGSGAATGSVTVYGLRVHIQYLREQFARQLAEAEALRARLETVEKEQLTLTGLAQRAHSRIDAIEARA